MTPRSHAQIGFLPRAPRRYPGVIVWVALWSLLRLPIAVPDFHEVAHHHAEGAACLYHEHLNRWHGERPQSPGEPDGHDPQHPASLHWHWVIPGATLPEGDSELPEQPDEVQLGAAVSAGPGTDAFSRMLECNHEVAASSQAGTERYEHERVYDFPVFDTAFRADGPHLRPHFDTTAAVTDAASPGPHRYAPLRC